MADNIRHCFKLMRAFAPREALRYGVLSGLAALSVPLLALLIERSVNGVTSARGNEVWGSFAALAAVLLLSVLVGHLLRVSGVSLTEALNKGCTPQIIDKLNRVEYAYFDSASASDILECVSRDPAQSLAQLYKTLISCISLVIRILSLSLLYFKLSAVFGVTLCVLMTVEIAIGVLSNREFNRLYGEELPKERKLAYLGDLLTRKEPIFDLKINQSAGYVKTLRNDLADSVLKERVGINLKAERWYLIGILLMTAWAAALLYTLISRRLAGMLELGAFCTLLGSYPLLPQYQSELSYYLSSMGKDWFIVRALKELMGFKEIRASEEITDARPEIVFSHVNFKYPGTERLVLRDVSFTLSPGETLRQGTLSHVLLLALFYLLIQMTRYVFNIVQDICWNVGVEEKCRFRFQTLLSEKAAALPYIDFEDGRRHDCILRAKECVDAMAVTQSFTNLLATVESVITVIGLLSAMMVYSIWYLPVMLLSVAPYLISRIAAGREFYRLRWFQAPHIRKRNYFYSLFTSPAFQKEQRIFGFGDSFRIRWERERDLTVRETVSFKTKDSGRLALCEALITAGYVGGILLSLLLVKNGAIAIGVFGAGIYAFRTAQNSTQAFFSLYGILGEGLM